MLATAEHFEQLRTKREAATMDLQSLQHWANGMILTTIASILLVSGLLVVASCGGLFLLKIVAELVHIALCKSASDVSKQIKEWESAAMDPFHNIVATQLSMPLRCAYLSTCCESTDMKTGDSAEVSA
jgi:hypothetical protein